jgi:uncharacterized alpha-E superfamily protein
MTRTTPLLARYAEGMFWLARYVERVENIGRLIDVTQSFESTGRAAEAWYSLVRINADEEAYAKAGWSGDADQVKHFYLLDRDNPTSVKATMEAARTNARTLRPLISTEMWRQLNMFHREVMQITPQQLQGDALSHLCRRLKEGVQAHTGITEGTLFRDEAWHFYMIGRLVERADQTTRLLDIKYHQLIPAHHEERRLSELTQWSAVLRAAAGYHAFRRMAPVAFTAPDVVRFMITDPAFPRSVALCIGQIDFNLTVLRTRYGLRGVAPALERVEELRAAITGRQVERVIAHGLHGFLDSVQRDLIHLSAEIGTAFFRDWRPLAESQTQSQSQSQSQSGGQGQSQSQSQSAGPLATP